ncbi:MAG: hypothetical protein HKN19_04560 [Halioglobus sp.]|nr:hypothetical protein [Halioglobus sp.]
MRFLSLILALGALNAVAHTEPEIEAITVDGRSVILHEDHTWDFVEPEKGNPETSAVLTVTKLQDMGEACRMQLHMQNNLPFKIRSLVPRFTVYNLDNVMYDSKSKSFTAIKPTRDQYRELQFSLGCRDISRILVHGAERCTMGDIDMFNEEDGQCLAHIYMTPSDLINISK